MLLKEGQKTDFLYYTGAWYQSHKKLLNKIILKGILLKIK